MNASVLRILDANANRAREALRVLEDYIRFVLDDAPLSGALKQLRHDLASATATFSAEAILLRDTPGDVGTANKTASELHRADIAAVVTAAGKRLGEALRTIEEYLKTATPADAARIEAIRYRFYDLEQRIALTLRPAAAKFAERVRLYVLITESACQRDWLDTARQAIDGGADCLQFREKTLEPGEMLRRARQLVDLCHSRRILCIINDRPDIALLSGADGVHLGQEDLPCRDLRTLLGPERIIGVSTHALEQARQAVLDGADYIGVGPVFKSPTKPRDFLPGLAYARQIAEAALPIPAVAIAGISGQNIDQVLATGLRAVAVTASVTRAPDPRAAAASLKAKLAATPPSVDRETS